MKHRGWVLPVLAVLALVLSAVWWFVGRNAWRPPPALQPDLPAVTPLELPPRAVLVQARARPLLWPSRRPVQAASEAAAGEPGPNNELAQARLMAVLTSGDDKLALLQLPDGGVLKISTLEAASPWTLESFDGVTAVFLSRKAERVERPLEKATSPVSSAQSSPRRGIVPPRSSGSSTLPPVSPAASAPSAALPSAPPPALPARAGVGSSLH